MPAVVRLYIDLVKNLDFFGILAFDYGESFCHCISGSAKTILVDFHKRVLFYHSAKGYAIFMMLA